MKSLIKYFSMLMLTFVLSLSVQQLVSAEPFKIMILEEDVETNTSDVILPNDETGPVRFKTCAACETKLIRIDANSKFFVNDVQVTLAEFRAEARTPHRFMMVHYKPDTHVVTRLRLL